MPALLRAGPSRVYFCSNEADEPAHVHVDRAGFSAEFWIRPVRLACGYGFARRELGVIRRILVRNETLLVERRIE